MSEALLTQQVLTLFDSTQMTIQEIADELNTTYKVVWKRIADNRSNEERSARKRVNYRKSKLGEKNPMKGKRFENHHNWKGQSDDCKGYLTVVTPEWYDKDSKRVFLHHVVLAEHLGLSCIPDGFVVHHIDHDPYNNSINNLALLTPSGHSRLHQRERAETTRLRARATDSGNMMAPDEDIVHTWEPIS